MNYYAFMNTFTMCQINEAVTIDSMLEYNDLLESDFDFIEAMSFELDADGLFQ